MIHVYYFCSLDIKTLNKESQYETILSYDSRSCNCHNQSRYEPPGTI